MSVVKRFIAGAVCPRCGKMDCVRMYRDEEREHRECVECGFSDSLRLDGRPEPTELETRVNSEKPKSIPRLEADEVQVQPLKFYVKPKQARKDH
ncbi:YheV family putative zinc ribbon protein [Nitrincola tapanii]|uniref:YheV family putative metal-binding protein n=1 Tax=Nitrincola tapanii TaxID=1708751 RepID=A0A5A9VZG7_9GAMM|nr:YheV family putative zinc ribbon protein [Nitrincola tapanii]KAA0873793.1 YheV family putative metal-binding protein [Nitrincola tapanii]